MLSSRRSYSEFGQLVAKLLPTSFGISQGKLKETASVLLVKFALKDQYPPVFFQISRLPSNRKSSKNVCLPGTQRQLGTSNLKSSDFGDQNPDRIFLFFSDLKEVDDFWWWTEFDHDNIFLMINLDFYFFNYSILKPFPQENLRKKVAWF